MRPKEHMKNKPVPFSVGICAYNEESNIGRLIREIQKQDVSSQFRMDEILVIASGCTDKTEKIVKGFQKKDKRIKLISESVRLGKAIAVNTFIKKSGNTYLILESADTLPAPDCFRLMLESLHEPQVGLVGCRVIPKNDPETFMGYVNHLMWHLHHKTNLQFPDRPKVGELVALRKIFERIPAKSSTDEANIEPLIFGQEYAVRYCPEAVVYNRGPESLVEFLSRRRRCYAGHTRMKRTQGYQVVTYSNFRILGVFLANLDWSNPKKMLWAVCSMVLEAVARAFGILDAYVRPDALAVWKIALTTKKL